MPERHPLQSIKTFPSLVKYLRDELDWPIESLSIEDLTFDFTADELGLDAKVAPKIREIKQLRPLAGGQPWGIFFVSFEPKQLPVVALRKILANLVIRKRASANKSDRAAWELHDLLFISNFGEGDERQMTLAHFSEGAGKKDIPTLKVLGWDEFDTQLKIQHVEQELRDKLRWPADEANVENWRKQWSSAFTLRKNEVINTAKDLAVRLADLAKAIRQRVKLVLEIETDRGPLRKLYVAFREALIHDLDEDDFADMFAQTITYGLFSTAVSGTVDQGFMGGGTYVDTERMVELVPVTNPFLKEMLSTFLTVGGRRGKLDFDELGIQDVVEVLNSKGTNLKAVLRDFGNRGRGEDPVIHFYEDFLKQYDKKRKVERGVFYTPQPVVSYIVRSVHELLQTEFGLEDGLASTITWAEFVARHSPPPEGEGQGGGGYELRIPDGTDPNSPFVTILDPATGTATFLVEVIDVIYNHLKQKWSEQGASAMPKVAHSSFDIRHSSFADYWNAYVPQHLLPRLHGYELMMAPYAIAHMKIGLKLTETGYLFRSDERARIYLTNALEPPKPEIEQKKIEELSEALAHEAKAVNNVKRKQRFTVVIGNPPYSGISANMTDKIMALVEPYKAIDGVSLGERKIWTQDDYKKFFRFSEIRITDAGIGILGIITNHGFINEPTSRGMRYSLLGTFGEISVLDLHGSLKKREACPDGSPDKNVFDIEPGVAISIMRRNGSAKNGVTHANLWGLRELKYLHLNSHSQRTTKCTPIVPSPKFYLFVPHSEDAKAEFSKLVSVTDVFELGSNGIQTSRDHVVYGISQSDCQGVIEEFRAPEKSVSTADIRNKYWPGKPVAKYAPGDTRGWRVPDARRELRMDKNWQAKFRQTLYRPFDFRSLFYTDYMVDWPRTEVMSQMLYPNLSLCVGRAGSAASNQEWNIIFVAKTIVDMNLFYRGGNVSYPLWFSSNARGLVFNDKAHPNFRSPFLRALGAAVQDFETGEFGVPSRLSAEDIIRYIYSVFHSPAYRTRYAEFLKIDFPRIPLPGSLELFCGLAQLGGELVALHLLESPKVGKPITKFIGPASPEVGRVGWSDDTVWIDAPPAKKGQPQQPGSIGFRGVPEAVWNFHIGGYQVCHKWLKDRKGRTLSPDDIDHYHKIVVALSETIRLMAEIDTVIDHHGGWPGAFHTEAKSE